MQDAVAIDRYFTEQIVGFPFTVDIGRTSGVRQWSDRGVLVEWISGKASLAGMAAGSLWGDDPTETLLGKPVNLPHLQRWSGAVLAVAWALWSVLLVGLVWWWRA